MAGPAPSPEPVALPRSQSGSAPQHLLTTLLGDYWVRRPEHLPSGALVALLDEFGIGPTSARAALNRLARRGILETSRRGRNSYYGIAPSAVGVLNRGAHRFVSFGQVAQRWDGAWTVAAYSLASGHRELRYPLRSQLRWLGFAPLYDALWVSPGAPADQVQALFEELGIRDGTVFRTVGRVGGTRQPIDAWNLDEIGRSYSAFLQTYLPLRDRIRAGHVGGTEALQARTGVMDDWRRFPQRDPNLPAELLPEGWPRSTARRVFVEIYDALAPLATIRVRQIIERFAPALAPLAQPMTTVQHLARAETIARQQTA